MILKHNIHETKDKIVMYKVLPDHEHTYINQLNNEKNVQRILTKYAKALNTLNDLYLLVRQTKHSTITLNLILKLA